MLAEDSETIWNYCKFHFGDWVEMYTTDKVMMRRYEAFAQKYPEHCKLVKEDRYSMTFIIHPACMGVKPRAAKGLCSVKNKDRLTGNVLRILEIDNQKGRTDNV